MSGLGVKHDYDKALYHGTKAAEVGNIEAQYVLGCLYDTLNKPVESVEWLTKAGENGHIEAQYKLYYNGIGKCGNYEQAYKWFYKAAIRKLSSI